MRLSRNQLIFNALFCSLLLIVIIWALNAEYNRPWKKYQKEFNQLEYKITLNHYQELKTKRIKDTDKSLKLLERKLTFIQNRGERIQQLWLQDLGVTDRCITCHQGVDRPEFIKERIPFKTHSGDYLKHHPVEKYGCVVCHDGQGPALTVDAAHGEVKNWAKPLLKGHYAQSSCGKCHFIDQRLPLGVELSGASVFIEGWRLFMDTGCLGCHKLSGYKRPERIGPALTKIGDKVEKDWLIRWLKNPKEYLPRAKMPRYNLSDEEIGYIVSYLLTLKSSSLIKERFSSKTMQLEGRELVDKLGCLGCHRIGEKGNDFAPDLSNIGNKVRAQWLYEFLKNPGAYDPKTIIPKLMIPEKEIPSIVSYLMSLKKDKNQSGEKKTLPENIEKGRKLVRDLGCIGCHEIENLPFEYTAPDLDNIGNKRVDELVFGNVTGVEKTLINWLKIKVMNPGRFATDKIIAWMPNYGFNEVEAEALVTFLLSIKNESVPPKYFKTLIDPDKAEMRGKKVFERYNCLGCHRINNKGGEIGPDLSREAKKSRPEWLYTFLKKPYKIRPPFILKARMPNFNFSDKEINTIIEYLSYISGESYPYELELKKEIYPENIGYGERLYQEVFACSGCHVVDGKGGQVGPEHTNLASRLKRQWVEEWLKNPQAIKPDVRMPRFKFEDWEFEALTDYLMTLGRYRFVQPKKN